MTATTTGLRVVKAIYPILIERARAGELITYGELVDEVKARNPSDEVIAKVIPVSLGKRLLLLREFTTAKGLPDLSCLVVNASTKEVGEAYSDAFDPTAQRACLRAVQWDTEDPDFRLFCDGAGTIR